MTQMFNSHQDNIPMVVSADYPAIPELGEENADYTDHLDEITQPMTKWHWVVETSLKDSRTYPPRHRPSLPHSHAVQSFCFSQQHALRNRRSGGHGPVQIQHSDEEPARHRRCRKSRSPLLESKSPLLYVGDEITWDGAETEVQELAELLALPLARPAGSLGWSITFPTRHPLFLGDYQKHFRCLGDTDVMLNLGAKIAFRHGVAPEVKVIQVQQEIQSAWPHVYPTEVPMVANLKLATADLVAAVRSLATTSASSKSATAATPKSRTSPRS